MIDTANITQNIVKANIEIDWQGRMVIIKLTRNLFMGDHYGDSPRMDVINWMDIHAATKSIFIAAEEHEPAQDRPPFPFMMRAQNEIQLNPDWELLIKHMP